MSEKLRKCLACGQQLRIPGNIGGMLMACPTCGVTFASDFRLAVGKGPETAAVSKESVGLEVPVRAGSTFQIVV